MLDTCVFEVEGWAESDLGIDHTLAGQPLQQVTCGLCKLLSTLKERSGRQRERTAKRPVLSNLISSVLREVRKTKIFGGQRKKDQD